MRQKVKNFRENEEKKLKWDLEHGKNNLNNNEQHNHNDHNHSHDSSRPKCGCGFMNPEDIEKRTA